LERPLYAIGRLVKAFGIRGEVVVDRLGLAPARFQKLRHVLVGRDDRSVEKRDVEYVRSGEKGTRMKFDGIDTRNDAEQMVGRYLFVETGERVQPANGVFFVDQIVGLQVMDETGNLIGIVKEVLKMPAQDIYVIATGTGEIMVPAVKEFVRAINLEAGMITVHLIDGMEEG
jgi:16S rRNA processing protein RimM